MMQSNSNDKNMFSDYSYQLLSQHTANVIYIKDIPWVKSNGILTPLAMPHIPLEVNNEEIRITIKKHKALLANWTTDWDNKNSTSPWWWICCNQLYSEPNDIPSRKGKTQIKRGLKNCHIKILDPIDFTHSSYHIFCQSQISYGYSPPSKKAYSNSIKNLSLYSGRHFWGAFIKEQMVAFAVCQICDNAVILGSTKSDKAYHKYYPNQVLFYTITKYYLERNIKYITNGRRTLLHPSNINNFLEDLGLFRKVYCTLNIEQSLLSSIIYHSNIASIGDYFLLQKIIPKYWKELKAFQHLIRIAKKCQ